MIEIRVIDKANEKDINIKNEPFSLFGRMIPSYINEKWEYTVELFDKTSEMCFPDENYDYDELSKNSVFVGAYDNGKCVGLAILKEGFLKYMYLYDLKVNREYRRKNIGAMLIEKSKDIAKECGYNGVYTQGQDNNLAACLFYLKNGFVIGGFDSHVYTGTTQEGKSDIIFYYDAKTEGV